MFYPHAEQLQTVLYNSTATPWGTTTDSVVQCCSSRKFQAWLSRTLRCQRHPLLAPLFVAHQIVGYLKLAHLVPFSVLLDVTKMSSKAVMMALSAEGRRRGLLLRGNWAARPTDVWPKGPPHAADCLSVAHLLLHR